MSGVLVLGIVVSIIAVMDLLVATLGADSRPDFGIGHAILS